jgi:hypothetical protein
VGMPVGTFLWIDADAHAICLDAHRTLVEQHDRGDEVPLTIDRELPPTPTGFMAWGPSAHWQGSDASLERRLFAWDFRSGILGDESNIGTGFTFVGDDAKCWRINHPVGFGAELFSQFTDQLLSVDPDGLGLRVLPPEESAEDWPSVHSTVAAAVVVWTLLRQGGIIETVRRQPGSKAAKRRAAKRDVPEVELVRVRRRHVEIAQALRDAEQVDGEVDREAFRWVVSGHWRNQAYGPAMSLRRPTFIEPHLRGPEGAPIRQVRRRVIVL